MTMRPKRSLIRFGVAAASLVFGGALATAAPVVPLDAWRVCSQAIATTEQMQEIPRHLLSAIALAESGRKHPSSRKRVPWPWTVMAEGQGRYLATKQVAVDEVLQLQARGVDNIDVGCMQVNLYHHPNAFASLDEAFDPASNVAYAGRFLRSLFADTGAWEEAAGRYHSATPVLKESYRDKVVQIWDREQRLASAGVGLVGPASLGPAAGESLVGRADRLQVRSPALLLSMADRRAGLLDGISKDRAGRTEARAGYFGKRAADADPMLARNAFRSSRLASADLSRTYYSPPTRGSRTSFGAGRTSRTLDEETQFAIRRAQYLQELREAVAQVKRLSALEVARNASPGIAMPKGR